ncbi:hypothetical protein ACET3X_001317 [Alternaria dauci]|uniref:Uncharacterized protein n=1 Tax=Alternaria dauci TaxID=48095 RepID=A0ABR3UY05_9PLEO
MSATTNTTSGSAAPANNTDTSVALSQEEPMPRKATEVEAKRVATVATQEKLEEEFPFKSRRLILKDKPSRPTHRPAKKNRKPLSPPSNKNHDTRTATVKAKAVNEERKELASLSVPRPKLNYDTIVEQRVVNGTVEPITEPVCSQPTFVVSKSPSVYEDIAESHDTPQAAASDTSTDSDPVAESDKDSEGDVPQLIRASSTASQGSDSLGNAIDLAEAASAMELLHEYDDVLMTDVDDEPPLPSLAKEVADKTPLSIETVSGACSCCPSSILSMQNAALYPLRLSRDEEAALVSMHVAPVQIPVTVSKQQKLNKTEKKVANAPEIPKEAGRKQPELDTARTTTGVVDIITPVDDGYVATLLNMPNGSGMTKESRDLHEKLIAMHVAPLSALIIAPKQQKTSKSERKATKADQKAPVLEQTDEPNFVASLLSKPNGPGESKEARDLHNAIVRMHIAPFELPLSHQQQKKAKEAKSAEHVGAKSIHGFIAVDMSASDKKIIVGDDQTFVVAELIADEFNHEEDTLIEDVSKFDSSAFTKAKDDLQQITVQVKNTIEEQTAVIPDDNTPVTPLMSDPDLSSSSSDYQNSTKTSSHSPVASTLDFVRRKAEEARTTFLGKVSLEMFINTLHFELCDGTTTKDDVCEAFSSLAGRPTADLESIKTQRKIKLGNTSLYGFLHQLDFDNDGVTFIGKVINVYNETAKNELASSKLDVAFWLAESSRDEDSRQSLYSQRASQIGGFPHVNA